MLKICLVEIFQFFFEPRWRKLQEKYLSIFARIILQNQKQTSALNSRLFSDTIAARYFGGTPGLISRVIPRANRNTVYSPLLDFSYLDLYY